MRRVANGWVGLFAIAAFSAANAFSCTSGDSSNGGALGGASIIGGYTSDEPSAPFRAVVFASETTYFAYHPGCAGADDGCRSQGTYTVDANSGMIALTDGDTKETQTFGISVKDTTTASPPSTDETERLHTLETDAGLVAGQTGLVSDAGAGGLLVANHVQLVQGTNAALYTRSSALVCGASDWAVDDCSAQGAYASATASPTNTLAGTSASAPAPASATPVVAACTCAPLSATSALRFDQLGYRSAEAPWAVWVGTGSSTPPEHVPFQVLDASGARVSSGTTGARVFSGTSMAHAKLTFDHVALTANGATLPAGSYTVVVGASGSNAGKRFGPINVGDNVYATALPKVLGFLREQRCGQVDSTSIHASCHLHSYIGTSKHSGDGVAVPAVDPAHDQEETTPSAITHGTPFDAEGGWHDAGDYIKFLGTSAYVIAVELVALRDHGAALASPQAGNVAGTLKTEMRWGLDWVLKMVGGPTMYHQVSGPQDHNVDNRVPSADATYGEVWHGAGDDDTGVYAQRPVFPFLAGHGGNLLGRSAAALALGAQIFATEDPAYAARLLTVAKKVFGEAQNRMSPQQAVSSDFYSEDTLADDLTFGAAELARASTGSDAQMYQTLASHWGTVNFDPSSPDPLAWDTVHVLALREAALASTSASGSAMAQTLSSHAVALAAPFATPSASAPGGAFNYPLSEFGNNSIPDGLGAAAACLAAKDVGGSANCVQVARDTIHWLFGQNPFGASFVVGLGTRYPKHPQHAFAQAAHKQLDGMIVGGPAAMSVLTDARHDDGPDLHLPTASDPYAPYSTSLLVYDDNATDFVTSEAGIDYTAALVYILSDLIDQ